VRTLRIRRAVEPTSGAGFACCEDRFLGLNRGFGVAVLRMGHKVQVRGPLWASR